MPSIVVVVGPTASGKSALAVRIARKFKGEVISADSRQVYKGLDIGTGKITKKEMRGVPHHMLDVASPARLFTAHDYARKARPILEKILNKGKTAVICGGTGFYIDVLLGRIALPDVPPNASLRAELREMPAPQLYAMLKKIDSRRAGDIDRHNPARLIRAIEIAKARGKVPKMETNPLPYEITWTGIQIADAALRARIHDRLMARMKSGMVAEARRLHARGLSYKRMESLGLEYRYLSQFLQKKISRGEMLERLEAEIWRYARRQMTYWRRNPAIRWKART